MYRAVALKALRLNVDPRDQQQISALAEKTNIELRSTDGGTRVYLDGEDVTEEIRRPEVSDIVALVAEIPGVRRHLVRQQRRLAEQGGVILEGRDTGSHVAPHADIKIYLTADLEERVQRRWEELIRRGFAIDKIQVAVNMQERDRLDSNRSVSPLLIPEGAVVINSTGMTVDEVVRQIMALCRQR